VASTAEGKGIHVVNYHTKYKEWEFVYDLKNDKSVLGAAAGVQQQLQQQQLQQQQGGSFGTGPLSPNQPQTPTQTPTPTPAPAPTPNQ
jgi:hypothetical protein